MSEKIKLYNLTDVPTPELERRHLINATLAVWQHLVQPGEMVEVEKTDKVLAAVRGYIEVGAMAADTLPPAYVTAKEKFTRTAPVVVPEPPAAPTPESPREERRSRKG